MTVPARPYSTHGSVAWPVTELIRLYSINAVALIALLAAWWAASGTVRNSSQVLAAAVGVTALIASGSANAMWLMVGRRNVGARRVALRSQLEQLVVALDERLSAHQVQPLAIAGSIVTLPNGTKYHRDGCDLVRGKPTVAWQRSSAGRVPCGVCQP